MNSFGYQIVQALVTDIVPDGKVREAMNDINAAQRLRCPPPPPPPPPPPQLPEREREMLLPTSSHSNKLI